MRQIAPSALVSTPLPAARPLAELGCPVATVAHTSKPPAGNQPWFGRDDCHCDDGPERMAKRAVGAVSARW